MILIEFICTILVLLSIYFITASSSGLQQYEENQECYNMLPPDYRKYEAPLIKGHTTKVGIGFVINNVDDIDESNMVFGLHGLYVTEWEDNRLILNNTVIRNTECARFIWVPKILFTAAEMKQDYDIRENLLHIDDSKFVSYTQRFGIKVGCKMFFKDYPFDTQICNCPVKLMESFLWNVSFEWAYDNDQKFLFFGEEVKPLQYFLKTPIALEESDGLSIQLVFVRQLMGSVINIFVPSSLIVAVSWISFWIRVEAAPARVSLSVTTLLALCTQVQTHKSQLPKLNYVIAQDIWLFVCIFMVFGNLVEFAISYNSYVIKRESSSQSLREVVSAEDKENSAWIPYSDNQDKNTRKAQPRFKRRQNRRWFCSLSSRNVTKIDRASRIVFPLTFIVFVTAFWGHYLSSYWKEL